MVSELPFFFFQAEDGIRYATVTGVQTCALPICPEATQPLLNEDGTIGVVVNGEIYNRSEERRVGKSVDLGGRRIIKKKKIRIKKRLKQNKKKIKYEDNQELKRKL